MYEDIKFLFLPRVRLAHTNPYRMEFLLDGVPQKNVVFFKRIPILLVIFSY